MPDAAPEQDLHARFQPDYTPEQLEHLGVYDALYRGQAPRLASLGEWKPEWLSAHDPKGWAQWYKRYAGGRRISGEDERQIKRWLSFKARHGGPFSQNPTPRRGWALRNWGIDPSKLAPQSAQEINDMLDEHQRKAMQKYVQQKVAAEKAAISAKLVHRTAMRGIEGVAKGTVTPDRMQKFVGTASKWLPGAQVRNMVQEVVADAGQKVPAALKGALPVLQAKRALPASVQSAFLRQPVARAANLGAEAVPTATSALRDAMSGIARGSTGELIGLIPGGHGVSFSRGTNTVSGVGLGKPSSLFHELGHGLDHAVGAMRGRSPIGKEIMAWRRGSQMYDTWRRALPAAQQVGLPTQKQFLASRKGSLNSYRLDALKHYLGNAPGFIQHVASNPEIYRTVAKTAALSPDIDLQEHQQRKAMQKYVQQKVAAEKAAISAKLVTRALGSATDKTLRGAITPARFGRFVTRAQNWLPKHLDTLESSLRPWARSRLTAFPAAQNAAPLRAAVKLTGEPSLLPKSIQTAFRGMTPANALMPKVESYFGQLGAGRQWFSGPTGLGRQPENIREAVEAARATSAPLRSAAYWVDKNTSQPLLAGGPTLRQPFTLFHELGHAVDDARGTLSRAASQAVGPQKNTLRNEIIANRYGSQLYRRWLSALPENERGLLPTSRQFLQARRAPMDTYHAANLRELLDGARSAITKQPNDNVDLMRNLRNSFGPGAHGRVTTKLLDQLDALGNMKTAALSPDIDLQEHQQRVSDRVSGEDPRLLVYHGLGSGKSLSAIAAAEAAQKVHGGNYGVVVPASLRGNFQKELAKFAPGSNPEILSYSGLALGKKFQQPPETLVMDEAQRLRNPESAASRAAREAAQQAKRLVLLSGTPITNSPSDMANLISMLANKELTPKQFEERYVGYKSKFPGIIPYLRGAQWGEVPYVKNEKELRKLLEGRVDYQPSKTPEGVDVQEEQIKVPLSKAQQKIQKAIRTKVPPGFLWKLDQEFPLSREELAKMNSFLNGMRQISLSTQSFRADRDPLKAFDQSSKLQTAMSNLQKALESDKRKKALIYSNFVESGVNPYAAALDRAKIPYGVFHGGIPTDARQKALKNYNEGKLRALLIGPAGAEGISTRGTNLIQLLDPHWNEARIQQARGRGLRFDSHAGLPEDLKNVQVQRYLSGSEEPGFLGKLLGHRRQRTGDEVLETLSQNKEQLNEKFRQILREVGAPKRKPGQEPEAAPESAPE